MTRAATICAMSIALVLSNCGGDDDKATATPVPTGTAEAPETTAPPTAAGRLPRELIKCMADQGYDIESADEIHSAPAQVLEICFGSIHDGGAP